MDSYTAKPEHAYISIFFVLMFLIVQIWVDEKYSSVMWWGAFLCGVVFLIIIGLLIGQSVSEVVDKRTRTITEFAKEFGKLDDEARQALAMQFPRMRYHMKRGVVREMFEDTNVPVEMFRDFLTDSNERYISPKRNWQNTERPAWAWVEIQLWLQDNGYIIEDSAAGNHSWLWLGGSYQRMCAYWKPISRVQDLNKQEFAYAKVTNE